MPTTTRKRPRKSGAKKAPEVESATDVDDLDGLADIDVDDLDDLDISDLVDDDQPEAAEAPDDEDEDDLGLDDEVEEEIEEEEPELEEEDEPEAESGDEFDAMDRSELKRHIKAEGLDVKVYKSDSEDDIRGKIRDASGADEVDEIEELDEEPIEGTARERPAPRKRAPAKAAAPPSDRPLTEAQEKMLKAAVKNKNGAKVGNIGQQRTADSLLARKLVKRRDESSVTATAAGRKYVERGGPAPARAPSKAAPAKEAPARRARTNGEIPKGMVDIARIAKAVNASDETVRRVVNLNDDVWAKHESGRWLFTKEQAKDVIREVRAYVKYTGGGRGRPKGSVTELPDGKVGTGYIAEKAGVHQNTVYNFLRKHADKLAKFRTANNTYAFTVAQADKLAAKIAG